jgi:MFS transporter, PPP family, 3-phenylpropionic acid transporter
MIYDQEISCYNGFIPLIRTRVTSSMNPSFDLTQKHAASGFGRLKLFTFFMYGTYGLFTPFLPIYFQEAGFTTLQIGLLLSVGPVMAVLANPFWGFVSDRLQNMKLILIILLSGNLLTSQIVFELDWFVAVFASILAYYFFQSALSSMNNTMIFQSIEKTDYKFGAFRMYGSLGFAVTALAAGPIIQWAGIAEIGRVYGLSLIATIAIAAFLQSKKKRKKTKREASPQLRDLFRNLPFVLFLMSSMLIFIPNSINSVYIALYIQNLGGSEVSVGWSWFLAAILEVPVFLLLDRYLPRSKVVMTGALIVTAVLFGLRWLLMGIAMEPMHILLVQLLHSITFGTYMYIAAQMCEYMVGERQRASSQAMYALVQGALSNSLGAVIGGLMFDTVGAHRMYFMGVIITAIGLGGIVWLRKMLERSPETDGA